MNNMSVLRKTNFQSSLRILLVLVAFYPAAGQTSNSTGLRQDKERQAKAFYDEGTRLISLDTFDSWMSAVEPYERARKLYQELGDSVRVKDTDFLLGFVNNHIGLLYQNSFDYKKALEFYDRALPFYKSVPDSVGEGDTLNNIGKVHESLGEKLRAVEFYKQTLKIFRDLGDRRRIGRALNNIGVVFHDLGEHGEALKFLIESLPFQEGIAKADGKGRTLSNIGSIYLSLGNYRKALEYFEQALAIQRLSGDKFGAATTLNDIGLVFTETRDLEKALDSFEKAMAVDVEAGNRSGEARTLNNIGSVYLRVDDLKQALSYFERSLEKARSTNDLAGESAVLVNIGSVHYRSPSARIKALDNYAQALSIFRNTGNKAGEAIVLHNIMLAWDALNRPRTAIFFGKEALNKRQQIRRSITTFDKETRIAFLQTLEGSYRKLAELLVYEGRLAEAQAVLDLLKDDEYNQLTRSDRTDATLPYSRAEAAVLEKIENLVALERRRFELQKLQTHSREQDTELEQLRLDIVAANRAFDASLDTLGRSRATAASRVEELKGGQEIQSALTELARTTNSGVVALYTVLGAQDKVLGQNTANDLSKVSKFGWVVMVTEKGYKAFPIDAANLEENVFQFRNALSSGQYDPRPFAQKIYTAIFRQTSARLKRTLEDDLRDHLASHKDKTLMWSLDGVLRYIPMAALHDGKQYLVEKYRNVLFTRQSFLWLTRENQPDWQALGLGLSERRENFDALPGVKTELETIIREPDKQTGIMNGSIMLNESFRKQMFFNTVENGSYPVVHIASHYSFNAAQQEASFLLLGDGRLSFGELKENKNLFRTVDLLTLSACDTATTGNGKEAEGFAYLAQSLGARSVIASLWKVSDAGTPELMIRFYKLRAEDPRMTKGEAFRQAQLSLLHGDSTGPNNPSGDRRSEILPAKGKKDELRLFVKDDKRPFAHPHYWSSFVLIGNWR